MLTYADWSLASGVSSSPGCCGCCSLRLLLQSLLLLTTALLLMEALSVGVLWSILAALDNPLHYFSFTLIVSCTMFPVALLFVVIERWVVGSPPLAEGEDARYAGDSARYAGVAIGSWRWFRLVVCHRAG